MVKLFVLSVFCFAGVVFMLYVFVNLEREIRREKRDRSRVNTLKGLSMEHKVTSIGVEGAQPHAQLVEASGTHDKVSELGELTSNNPATQPIRRRSSGGSR